MDTKISPEEIIRKLEGISGRNISRVGTAKGKQDSGRPSVPGHNHELIEISPKYSVTQVAGYIKGKSAIGIARNYLGRKRGFTG
jgi:hypothetical protein